MSRIVSPTRETALLIRALYLRWLARRSAAKAGLVLVYHRVGGEASADPELEILPTVPSDVFDRQLDHLKRRYRVVPAGDIVEAARRRRRGERFPVAITFDDDLVSHVRDAVPALRRKQLTATYFLCGSWLDAPRSFWWEDLQRAIDGRLVTPEGLPHLVDSDVRAALDRRPRAILDLTGSIIRLSPEQRHDVAEALRAAAGPPEPETLGGPAEVRALTAEPGTIGFHTLEHDVLPSLSDAALADALRAGRETLAEASRGRLDLLAYPHGKADSRVAQAAREAGFALGFTTARGLVTPETDPHLVPRTVPDLSTGAFAHRLARAFARAGRDEPSRNGGTDRGLELSSSSVSRDVDSIVQENQRLLNETVQLRARVRALESSRWWRLHPRFVLHRLRTGTAGADPAAEERDRVHELPPDFDEADAELCRVVAPFTMTTPARIYALTRAVEYIAKQPVDGAIVECGVWRGGSMMAVALTLLRLGATDRDLYLFDTFTGMTEPGKEDVKHTGETAADILAGASVDSDDWAIAGLDQVREAVLGVGYPEERIHFVAGPVEDTLPEHAPAEIALLRLDTDWYSSTKHELVHLYPRLAPGGVLLVDDYAYWHGARRAVDEYIEEHGLSLLLNRIDYTARIAVRP